MESELLQIECFTCSNKFWIKDQWETGCRDNDEQKVPCPKCSSKISISINGLWDYHNEKQETLKEYGFKFSDIKQQYKGVLEMATLKEMANDYKSPETKNIADLKSVSVDIEITEVTRMKTDGEEFTLNLIEVNGEEYRVPNSVLKQLKAQLEIKPNAKEFAVQKSGTGLNTEYTVVLL